jgi:hypothetical protein
MNVHTLMGLSSFTGLRYGALIVKRLKTLLISLLDDILSAAVNSSNTNNNTITHGPRAKGGYAHSLVLFLILPKYLR